MKYLLFVALMLPFSVSAGFYVCISETGVKGAQDFPCNSSDTTVTAVTDDDQREMAGERKAKSKRTDWDWLEPHVEDNSVDESKGKQWYYKTIKSEMTQRNVNIAILKSENQVNFDFPYSGLQKASLMLKESGSYGQDVLFSIEKGQILCSSNDCSVYVRFDEGNLITFPASEPSDYSTDAIFIKDEGKFAKGMLSSKKIRISVTIYQEGVNTFIFDVSDFNYSKFKPIAIKKISLENKALFEIGEFGMWVTFKPDANNSKVFSISLPSNESIVARNPVQLLSMRCKDKEPACRRTRERIKPSMA